MEHGGVTDAVIAASGRQAHELWALREHVPEAQRLDGPSIKHDISVAVSRIPEFIATAGARLQALMPGIRIVCFGHVGDGNFHVLMLLDADSEREWQESETINHNLVRRAIAADGTCTGEHGVGLHKMQFMAEEHGDDALDLMRSLKHAFDPNNILNPGKIVSW